MKFAQFSLAVAALVASVNAQTTLTINTPSNVVECQPILLTWTGGTPPYIVSIQPGGQPGAAALETLPSSTGTSQTWVVNEASGTSLGLAIRDSTGLVAQSAPFTVNPGTDASCLTSSAAAGSSTTAATGTTTAAGTTTGATTTPATTTAATTSAAGTTSKPTSTTPGSSTSSHATTTSSGAASSSSNAGSAPTARFAELGVAGVVGAMLAAIVV